MFLHSQRLKNSARQKRFERFTRDGLDDAAQRIDAGIAIRPFDARLKVNGRCELTRTASLSVRFRRR